MHRRMQGQSNGVALLAAVVCVTLLAVAGCGDGGAGATATPPASSASPTAAPSVAEDLTFTGALAGHLAAGSPGDAYVCAATGGAFVAGPILGTLAGEQIEMTIVKTSFAGAGVYSPAGVSFDVGSDHYYPVTGAAGTLVVAADVQSGSVDIDLAVNTDPNHAVAHVRGTWRCPPGGS